MEVCKCCSGKEYSNCCEPFIKGSKVPEWPAELMRSRFTAFVLSKCDYIFTTWHESDRPSLAEISQEPEGFEWTKLAVLQQELLSDNKGVVVFKAEYVDKGVKGIYQEKSEFVKENGRWYYTKAIHTGMTEGDVQRNDKCLCGSGKKYKHCCGK